MNDDDPRTRRVSSRDDDDAQFLLKELKYRVELLERAIQRKDKFSFSLYTGLGAVASLVSLLSIWTRNIVASNADVSTKGAIATSLLFGSLLFMVTVGGFYYIRQVTVARDEVRRRATVVTNLVRRASQLVDRGKMSFASKLLAEIELGEAEALLAQIKASHGWDS